MKRTVLALLNDAAIKYRDKPYVVEKTDNGWIPKSYNEVKEEAEILAAGLLEHKLRDKNLAILSEGRTSWIVSEYGIIKSGGISVPLSTKLLAEELPFRLNHSESKGIFTSRNSIHNLLSIWDRLEEKNFKIIYYDDDREAVQEKCQQYNPDIYKHIIFYSDLLEQGKKRINELQNELENIEERITEDDVVTISYTSGTTGNPKGIMLTQLNYYGNATESFDYFQIERYLRLLVVLPIDHSFAHTVALYTSLVAAFSIYFVDARGGSKAALRNITGNLKEVGPHFLITVPSLTGNFMNKIQENINKKGGFAKWLFYKGLHAGMEYNGDGYTPVPKSVKRKNAFWYKLADRIVFRKVRKVFGDYLQYCIGGGALLDIRQQRFYYALGIPVYQGYGLTESSPIISINHPSIHKLGSSGKILPTLSYKIKDGEGNELPKGQKGELVIKGTNVMKGYFKNPSATEESIKDGWLYTGDLGYMDKDDFLVVVGREKALLISEDGEKYSPEEIEEAMTTISDMVNQVMVHNNQNKYTSALITLNTEAVEQYMKKHQLTSPDEVLEAIKQSLYSFKQDKDYANKFPKQWLPSTFVILEQPFSEENHMINSTMKMVRYKIVEAYQDKIDFMYTNEGAKISNGENMRVIKQLFFNNQ